MSSRPHLSVRKHTFFYVNSENEAVSVSSYLRTKFVRFLVSLRKITQHATRSTYSWVPKQVWKQAWRDEILYQKYGLTKDEITLIESSIRPMESTDDED